MTSVNDLSGSPFPPHIANLLGHALKRLRTEILATSEENFPGLRVSHYRLLELIPPEGARITDLAEVAGMTKQGLGQHVDYLQKLGYTESDRPSGDRRVRLVRRTARGDRAVRFGQDAIGRVETLWAERLGPERYRELRETLTELGD